jgi:hypothetical protein
VIQIFCHVCSKFIWLPGFLERHVVTVAWGPSFKNMYIRKRAFTKIIEG